MAKKERRGQGEGEEERWGSHEIIAERRAKCVGRIGAARKGRGEKSEGEWDGREKVGRKQAGEGEAPLRYSVVSSSTKFTS